VIFQISPITLITCMKNLRWWRVDRNY